MKKVLAVLLALAMVLCIGLAACTKEPANEPDNKVEETSAPAQETENPTENNETPVFESYDAIADDAESADGTYAVAFVTDVGQLKDKSFNQGTWEGVKRYAYENGKTYKYYQPANGNEATDTDRYNAMKAAVDAGAEIIVAAGFMQGSALTQAAAEFTDVKFVFIDGNPLSDEDGNNLTNVAPIVFQEEQSGYLAGYAVVKEGYEKLGFTGGGGGTNPAVNRYGYGFVQGANDAAKELDKEVEVNYTFLYGGSFSPSTELQTLVNGWYTNGTEVVFSCGGSISQSVFAAAGANDAYAVGVDVDQSGDSDTVITSAMKGLREAVMVALDRFYSGRFDEIGGVELNLGAADDAVGLPTDTWSLENFSVSDYEALLAALKSGSVTVDADYNNLTNDALSNVTLNVVE